MYVLLYYKKIQILLKTVVQKFRFVKTASSEDLGKNFRLYFIIIKIDTNIKMHFIECGTFEFK